MSSLHKLVERLRIANPENRPINVAMNLAVCYTRGLGVPKDYGKAVYWYNLSANQGNAHAQAVLARIKRIMP